MDQAILNGDGSVTWAKTAARVKRCGHSYEGGYWTCGMAAGHRPADQHGRWLTPDEWAEYERTGRWEPPSTTGPARQESF